MTQNGNLKRRVRARAAKTGESYTSALQHIRRLSGKQTNHSVRMAVAQTSLFSDPRDAVALRSSGAELRRLMREAHKAGARLLHLPEGATCWPNKRTMSDPDNREIGPSDWTRVEWEVLRAELEAIRQLAGELKLWTILGCVHQLTAPNRPHNSLYVVSDLGELVTRYDERLLSKTKMAFMYSPGKTAVTFEVDGLLFGCALGMEVHYPELFIEYEKLAVDCVLFSTAGASPDNAEAFAAEVLGHAASNVYWVSYSTLAPQSIAAPSGIAGPDGKWATQCPMNGMPAIAVTDIAPHSDSHARSWRREARSDPYAPHRVYDDLRSDSRDQF